MLWHPSFVPVPLHPPSGQPVTGKPRNWCHSDVSLIVLANKKQTEGVERNNPNCPFGRKCTCKIFAELPVDQLPLCFPPASPFLSPGKSAHTVLSPATDKWCSVLVFNLLGISKLHYILQFRFIPTQYFSNSAPLLLSLNLFSAHTFYLAKDEENSVQFKEFPMCVHLSNEKQPKS